jgi:hypothetical protein
LNKLYWIHKASILISILSEGLQNIFKIVMDTSWTNSIRPINTENPIPTFTAKGAVRVTINAPTTATTLKSRKESVAVLYRLHEYSIPEGSGRVKVFMEQ